MKRTKNMSLIALPACGSLVSRLRGNDTSCPGVTPAQAGVQAYVEWGTPKINESLPRRRESRGFSAEFR